MNSTLTNLGNDHGFISEDHALKISRVNRLVNRTKDSKRKGVNPPGRHSKK